MWFWIGVGFFAAFVALVAFDMLTGKIEGPGD